MTSASLNGGKVHQFDIPDRVRVARENTGMDQTELAEATGLSRASISNYERGVSRPRRSAILLIAMATGFDAGWLETGKAPHPDNPSGGLEERNSAIAEPID